MSNLIEVQPEYVYTTIPREYVDVYHRILAMMADYGEDMLKDCKASCTERNSGVIECFNMFNSAIAARKLGNTKLAETLIKYVRAKIEMIYKGKDNATSFIYPLDEYGELNAIVSSGDPIRFEIDADKGELYQLKYADGFKSWYDLSKLVNNNSNTSNNEQLNLIKNIIRDSYLYDFNIMYNDEDTFYITTSILTNIPNLLDISILDSIKTDDYINKFNDVDIYYYKPVNYKFNGVNVSYMFNQTSASQTENLRFTDFGYSNIDDIYNQFNFQFDVNIYKVSINKMKEVIQLCDGYIYDKWMRFIMNRLYALISANYQPGFETWKDLFDWKDSCLIDTITDIQIANDISKYKQFIHET